MHRARRDLAGWRSRGYPSRRRECRSGRVLWLGIELHYANRETLLRLAPCDTGQKHWRSRHVEVVLDEEEEGRERELQVWGGPEVLYEELEESGTFHKEEMAVLRRTTVLVLDPCVGI